MVDAGATLASLAAETGADPSTIRRWLRRCSLETRRMRTLREAAEARARGVAEIARVCPEHGLSMFRMDSRGSYRCGRCNSARVLERRRAIKRALLAEMGGQCALCGYDACHRALEFHHMDPSQKLFGIGYQGVTRSLERARAEATKCVLLCSNCHAEVEAGVTELP